MFEWQRHSQEHADVPDYQELLDFLNLRAQASEASTEKKRATVYFAGHPHFLYRNVCLLWQGETSVVHVQQVSLAFSQQQDGVGSC